MLANRKHQKYVVAKEKLIPHILEPSEHYCLTRGVGLALDRPCQLVTCGKLARLEHGPSVV